MAEELARVSSLNPVWCFRGEVQLPRPSALREGANLADSKSGGLGRVVLSGLSGA